MTELHKPQSDQQPEQIPEANKNIQYINNLDSMLANIENDIALTQKQLSKAEGAEMEQIRWNVVFRSKINGVSALVTVLFGMEKNNEDVKLSQLNKKIESLTRITGGSDEPGDNEKKKYISEIREIGQTIINLAKERKKI